MKEIKAYIRRDRVNRTVVELKRAGAPGITVVEVHPVGYGYEPNYFEADYVDEVDRYRYLSIVRLEVVCADDDLEKLLRVVQNVSHTGNAGDGIIFVVNVADAIRIRDGQRGEKVLEAGA